MIGNTPPVQSVFTDTNRIKPETLFKDGYAELEGKQPEKEIWSRSMLRGNVIA